MQGVSNAYAIVDIPPVPEQYLIPNPVAMEYETPVSTIHVEAPNESNIATE